MVNTPDKVVFVWLHLRQRDIHIPAAGDFELAIKKSTMKMFLNHFPHYLLSDKDMACPKKEQIVVFFCHISFVIFFTALLLTGLFYTALPSVLLQF